mmetsp:Transcript_20057/g.35781  ORF Transcript_20057/g.35781 Transcript_20057/m.35781 type:complete len:98 (+) Transcript_20057:140-433(+)
MPRQADEILHRSQRRKKFPWKTLLLCLVLSAIGAIFIPVGVYKLHHHGLGEAIAFFMLGGLGAIPGFFHLIIFIKAYLGHRGYRYEQIPGAFEELHE